MCWIMYELTKTPFLDISYLLPDIKLKMYSFPSDLHI